MSDVIQKIRSGIYVYPEAIQWNSLYEMLTDNLPEVDVPRPLILAASIAIDYDKNQRLKEQIDLAEQNGLLREAIEILESVPEERWVKSYGKLDPNETPAWVIYERKVEAAEKAWYDIYRPILQQTKARILRLIDKGFITNTIQLEELYGEVIPFGFPYDFNEVTEETTLIEIESLDWSKYEAYKEDLMAIYMAWQNAYELSKEYDTEHYLADTGGLNDFFYEAMEE